MLQLLLWIKYFFKHEPFGAFSFNTMHQLTTNNVSDFSKLAVGIVYCLSIGTRKLVKVHNAQTSALKH